MARVLIVGEGSRICSLGGELRGDGHAVRILTRHEERRAEIEALGAECAIGDPDRLGTLRPALEHVAIVCWLLATAGGCPEAVEALHGSRLEQFLRTLVDTTVRGVVYEAGGAQLPPPVLAQGERIVSRAALTHSIPVEIVRADPHAPEEWGSAVRAAVSALLDPSADAKKPPRR